MEEICEHLHLDQPDEIEAVENVFKKAFDREKRDAPTRPTMRPQAPVVTMGAADLHVSGGAALNAFAKGEEKARGNK